MKQVELTQGKVALIDDEDWCLVKAFKWYALWERNSRRFCAVTNVGTGGGKQRKLRMHRLVMGEPAGQVDHRNGNMLDCRKENLRLATPVENRRNRGKQRNNTSGFMGVSRGKGVKWRAHIDVNGKHKALGVFPSAIDAALARDAAARGYFGAFARLNFPKPGEVSAC
jgi:HNH endonuclease